MAPLPAAKAIWVPTAWTASSAPTRPRGSVVGLGGWGAGPGWFCPGSTVTEVGGVGFAAVLGGAGAATPMPGVVERWLVERITKEPVTAAATVSATAAAIRTGRIATSPYEARPWCGRA